MLLLSKMDFQNPKKSFLFAKLYKTILIFLLNYASTYSIFYTIILFLKPVSHFISFVAVFHSYLKNICLIINIKYFYSETNIRDVVRTSELYSIIFMCKK